MARVRISYRVSLLVAIPALVLLLSGVVTWRSYVATTRETEELAHRLFRDLSRQTFLRTRERLTQALQSTTLLQGLSDQGRLSEDQKALAAELLPVLRSQPDYSWVSYSSEEGGFVGAYRASDGSMLVNRSWIAGGKTRMEEYAIGADGTWTLARKSEDYGYDPRKRPFYERAAREGKGIWTPPYVFFGQGIPGITYAAPRLDPKGRRTGVWSVDFDLNRLSDITRQAAGSGAGAMFMFTPDGTLLAHPDVKCVELDENKEGRLLKLSDVRDPVLRAYAQEFSKATLEANVVGRLGFEAAGEEYLAAGTLYRVNDELSVVVGMAAPSAVFLGPVRENLRATLSVTLLVLGAGFVVAVLLANGVARPLLQMSDEMGRVGAFDLHDVPQGRSVFKEIVRMEGALASMVRSLRSFAAYVPSDLVKRLVTSGRAARLEGETRRLTLLFSDVAGFTSISERLAPTELVTLLGGYLSEVASGVAAEGGTVDKFMGDGVLAFWNAPTPQPDHARRAVRAALAIRRRLESLRAAGDPRALATRIGLATGELVVGNVGTPERMNYTVVGDTANLAARLEALNKTYGTSILVSQETAEEAGDGIVFRPVDLVVVVGKRKAVRVLEPLCLSDDPEAASWKELAELTARAFAAYLGRDLDRAQSLYRDVLARRPGDSVAIRMIERCEDLRQSGFPDDWSGATTIRSK